MDIQIDVGSELPMFTQLIEQLSRAIYCEYKFGEWLLEFDREVGR